GAADALVGRVRHLVYIDAVVPFSGECWSSAQPAATQAARRAAIAQTGFIPPPDPSIFGLTGADHAWVARRQTPHPGGVYDAPLDFDAQRWAALPRTFVDCTTPALATIAPIRERVGAQPGWTVHEIATGHDAMVSEPDALVRILLSVV
ncbi:MAG: alpha/beta hydrolase, partial [Burkholderiaceae bacterium]